MRRNSWAALRLASNLMLSWWRQISAILLTCLSLTACLTGLKNSSISVMTATSGQSGSRVGLSCGSDLAGCCTMLTP